MVLNIVFSGIGGQGIVVASDIFCEAALMDGLDVAKAEVHGMAQRGGSIVAHVQGWRQGSISVDRNRESRRNIGV